MMTDVTYEDFGVEALSAAMRYADIKDCKNVIDALWRWWDTIALGGTSGNAHQDDFIPYENSSLYLLVRQLRQSIQALYFDSEFLAVLYEKGVSPAGLSIEAGRLLGRISALDDVTVLHVKDAGADGEGALLNGLTNVDRKVERLYRVAQGLRGCFSNRSVVTLWQAVEYYCDRQVVIPGTILGLSRLISEVEQQLQARMRGSDGASVFCVNEDLDKMGAVLSEIKASNVRSASGMHPWLRPSLDAYLGDSVALARNVLRKISEDRAFRQRCEQLSVNPDNIEYLKDGSINARAMNGTGWLPVFEYDALPDSLLSISKVLSDLAVTINADLRSDGKIRLSQMLEFYAVSYKESDGGWGTDDYLDDRLARVSSQYVEGPEYATLSRSDSAKYNGESRQPEDELLLLYQRLIDSLWGLHGKASLPRLVRLNELSIVVNESAPIGREWNEAKTLLIELIEHPTSWLIMREHHIALKTLGVSSHTLGASVMDDDARRYVFAGDSWVNEALKAKLEQLYFLSERFGEITLTENIPLASALYYCEVRGQVNGAAWRRADISKFQLLEMIEMVLEQRKAIAPLSIPYFDEELDLEQMQELLRVTEDVSHRYRPSLDSKLGRLLSSKIKSFREFLSRDAVAAAVADLIPKGGDIVFYEPGRVRLSAGAFRHETDLREKRQEDAVLDVLMDEMSETARLLGGALHFDGRISIAEAASYYGFSVREGREERSEIIAFLEESLGKLRCGFKAGVIAAEDILDESEEAVVQQVVEAFLSAEGSKSTLFQYLGDHVVGREQLFWHSTDRWVYFVSRMLQLPQTERLMKTILGSLGWYGGKVNETASPLVTASLFRCAIFLNFGLPSDTVGRKVMGYYLNKESNWGTSYRSIRRDFCLYLQGLGVVSAAAVEMASLFILHHRAPELLVEDESVDLFYGASLASTNFLIGVNIAERIEPGLSRKKNARELMRLSSELLASEGFPDQVKSLVAMSAWQPAVLWMRGRHGEYEVQPRATTLSEITDAVEAFGTQVGIYERALVNLLAPLPYRMNFVKNEILRVFPKYPGIYVGEEWDSTRFLLTRKKGLIFDKSFPFYEVYASGELISAADEWEPLWDEPIPMPGHQAVDKVSLHRDLMASYASVRKELSRLADANELYDAAYIEYFEKAKEGYGVLIEEILYQLPRRDILAIKAGQVELFTLRTAVPNLEAQQETPKDTNPYRGRFGVILKLSGEGLDRYYQLLPLLKKCSLLELAEPLRVGGKVVNKRIRTSKGSVTISVRQGELLPVDWSAYLTGCKPDDNKVSSVIVERLSSGTSLSSGASRSPFHAVTGPLVENFFWLDESIFRLLSRAETSLERRYNNDYVRQFTDFFVPFKENVRNLHSEQREEFTMAAFGVFLESILLGAPFAGKLFSIISRTGARMTHAQLGAVLKFSVKSTVEAFNPLSGSLALLRTGKDILLLGGVKFYQYCERYFGKIGSLVHSEWTIQQGMAILNKSQALPSSLGHVERCKVDGVHDVIASQLPGGDIHLIDPVSALPYGPRLVAEGLFEAGGGVTNVAIRAGSELKLSSRGGALRGGKQVAKGKDDEDERFPDVLDETTLDFWGNDLDPV